MKCQIKNKEDESHNELKEIGYNQPDSNKIIQDIKSELLNYQKSLQENATAPFNLFKKHIMDTVKEIDKSKIDEYYKEDAWDPIFFSGKSAFMLSIEDISKKFANKQENFIREIKKMLLKSMDNSNLMKNVIPALKDEIVSLWKDEIDKIEMKIDEEIDKEVKDASKYNTANHYLSSNFEEMMKFPKQVFDDFSINISTTDYSDGSYNSRAKPLEEVKKKMLDLMTSSVEKYYQEYYQMDLQEQQKIRVFNGVKAYSKVVMKTFIDKMLCIVRTHGFERREQWLNNFHSNKKLLDLAKENESITKRRKNAYSLLEDMEKCKQHLNDL